MPQPEFVPGEADATVFTGEIQPPPLAWTATRPAETLPTGGQPKGAGFGSAGPDQGYAIGLAKRVLPELVLADGEKAVDVSAGVLGVALARASLYGRAPMMPDLRLAFGLFGYLDAVGDDVVAWRKPRFEAVSHDYRRQRAIVDAVPEATLRMTPDTVRQTVVDGNFFTLVTP